MMKYRIQKIDSRIWEIVRDTHCTEFADDMVTNQGRVVTLHNLQSNTPYHTFFELHSENGVLWHTRNSFDAGQWHVDDDDGFLMKNIFFECDVEYLPEELFVV
jgi:hypothetical protein